MLGRTAVRRAIVTVLMVVASTALVACGEDEPEVPTLAMPDLVGTKIGQAEVQTYDALHTSLIYYDLSASGRQTDTDWVVVSTSPKAGADTKKFEKVYAWALPAAEYEWFQKNPTMPKLPARASVADLIGAGGPLEPVKALVKVRYSPGKAPKSAKVDPEDAERFTPRRGHNPEPADEPEDEWEARQGLLVAPTAGTLAVGSRPGANTQLRTGQFLVLLVVNRPPKKPVTPDPIDVPEIDVPDIDGGSGGGGGGLPGIPDGFPTPKIPNCPKQICG